MAPFEKASMTSYSTLMVTMALSASVSKLQPSEICLTSFFTSPGHSKSMPMAPFERPSMTSYSTLMVTMALPVGVSKLQPSEICVTSILTSPGHSRSKPMAPFERASMTSYSTLMVTMALFNFNGNHGPICKRFQVTALRYMRDLDFDLSMSLQVKANGAI